MTKTILKIVHSQYLFPSYLDRRHSSSPVAQLSILKKKSLKSASIVIQKCHTTGELLRRCLDSHHLLTNLSVKTCTTGLKDISPDAWKKVAKSYKTNFTPALVDDIVDKQSSAFAQTHFWKHFNARWKNGNLTEANLCRLIRRWYEARDMAALSISERISRWLDLREYLLGSVGFGIFPPAGQFVKGFSLVSLEGFLCGIVTKMQLYGLCGPYCVRTASSLPAETCVGGIQDMNINNSKIVNAKDVPKIMSGSTDIMTYKCDPNMVL